MSYDAVYAATRSAIGNPDISGAVERVCRDAFDVSHIKCLAQQAVTAIESDLRRPFMLLHPKMFPDGNQWCALYGDNLQDGVAGFGDTPDAASWAFDKAWNWSKIGATKAGMGVKEIET